MLEVRFDPVVATGDWKVAVKLYDSDTNEPFPMAEATAKLEIFRKGCCGPLDRPLITGSTQSGEITNPESNVLFWQFLATAPKNLSGLSPGPYDVKLTITRDGFTWPPLLGVLPVICHG